MSGKRKWIAATAALAALGAVVALACARLVGSGETASQVVNAFIDNLLATGDRMLELPVFMLLVALGVVAAASALVIALACGKGRHPRLRRTLLAAVAALVVLAVAFLLDRKIALLQNEIVELRSRMTAERLLASAASQPATACPSQPASASQPATKPDARRTSFLFDPKGAEDALATFFGAVTVMPQIYDQAADFVLVRRNNPVAQVYLAVVDVQHPQLEIRLGAGIEKKTLTSEFARQNNCTLAINGEAGRSPQADSGLGDWKGNLVDRGQVVLREDAKNPRPFLSFDRKNRATYTSAAAADRTVAPEAYNVIWGRSDALVDGQVQAPDSRDQQPRTAMGINKDGTRLYLVVVDGRQPNYSMGFTRPEVGKLLKAFGAHNAMLCDEGGSSCIYLKKFGGIADVPSDQRGKERPTYTHFGIIFRGSE